MAEAVAIAAETPAKPAEQEDDQNDDKDKSNRHSLFSVLASDAPAITPLRSGAPAIASSAQTSPVSRSALIKFAHHLA
jgi:hypothetical protein